MKKFLVIAIAAALFAGPASANCGNGNGNGNGCNQNGNSFGGKLTIKSTKSITEAATAGGSQSGSGAIGGSALIGVTGISVNNTGIAAGNVKAKNTNNASEVTQTYVTSNTTTLTSGSLGLAGNVGSGSGLSESVGQGYAMQKVKTTSIKLNANLP